MGKRGNNPKVIPPLKRLLHLESGEVWSWQQVSGGIRLRSPEGKTTYVHGAQFLEKVWDPGTDCDSYLNDWCSGKCYGCEPKFAGGYKPAILKQYIQTVYKDGNLWVNPLEEARRKGAFKDRKPRSPQ